VRIARFSYGDPSGAGGSGFAFGAIGGDPGAEEIAVINGHPFGEVTFVAVLFAAASVFFGVFPSPLLTLVAHAGRAFTGLF